MISNIIKDLRSQFGEVRDQGIRPTCIAFAASDCHSVARGSLEAMSVEYAFYHAVQKTTDKNRMKGVSFTDISDAISNNGQPIENGWKYINNLTPTDNWVPPKSPGAIFRHHSKQISSDLSDTYTNLDQDNPVILVIDVSLSFYILKEQTVLNAPQTEVTKGIHAVIAVGYGKTKGAKCVLIRNSWGNGWADKGYGWIDEEYLKPRLHFIAAMG